MLILMFVCSLSVDCQENIFNVNIVKGNFKQRTVYTYKYINGKIDQISKQKKWLSIFNNKGFEIEKDLFYKGKFSIRITYKYDTSYKLIEINSTGSSEQNIFKYKYENNGSFIQVYNFNQDNYYYGKETIELKLDENGNKIKTSIQYNHWDDKRSESICTFNEHGDIIEVNGHSSDFDYRMDWNSIYKYIYDKHGNKIVKVCYESDNTITMTTKYKYDKYGNVIEQIDYNKFNEPELKSEYIYSK
jgi:hypothetical protein